MNCIKCGKEGIPFKICANCYILSHPEECAALIHYRNHPGCNVDSCKDYKKLELFSQNFIKNRDAP